MKQILSTHQDFVLQKIIEGAEIIEVMEKDGYKYCLQDEQGNVQELKYTTVKKLLDLKLIKKAYSMNLETNIYK